MADIKKIQIGGIPYNLVDEYARSRLEGLGTAYATSVSVTWWNYDSNFRYYDITLGGWLGAEISSNDQIINGNLLQNGKDATDKEITNSSSGKYLVLLGDPGTPPAQIGGTTGRYVVALKDLTLGDTIYIKETNYQYPPSTGELYKDIPDYWVSVASGSSTTDASKFTPLEAKIDTSTIVVKGLYKTGSPNDNVTGTTGGQTGWADIGTATGSGTIDGLAPDVTGSTNLGSKNTSNNGAHTINGSNFTFTGTTATLTSNVSVSDHPTQTLTISGSQSVGNHSHSIGSSTTSLIYVSDVTVTAPVEDHTHSISGTGATQTVVTAVDAATGSAGGHSHTVDSHEHAADVIALTDGTTFNAGTTPSFGTIGTTVTKGAYGFSSNSAWAFPSSITVNSTTGKGVLSDPTVSVDGILSFTYSGVTTQASTEVAKDVTAFRNGTWDAGTTPSLTKATATVAGASSASTLNTSSEASHTHSIGKSTTSITYVSTVTVTGSAGGHSHTITPTKDTKTVVTSVDANTGNGGAHTVQGSNFSAALPALTHNVTNGNFDYQPAGTIGGSQSVSSHTHSVTLGAHTHSITAVSGTVSISVAVGSHSHAVNDHSHSLNNHTHSVTL